MATARNPSISRRCFNLSIILINIINHRLGRVNGLEWLFSGRKRRFPRLVGVGQRLDGIVSVVLPDVGLSIEVAICLPNHLGPVGVEVFTGWLVDALVGVGTEEVTLGLEQIGWQACCAIGIVVSERCAECGNWNAVFHC